MYLGCQDGPDLPLSEGRELNGLGGEARASASPVLLIGTMVDACVPRNRASAR